MGPAAKRRSRNPEPNPRPDMADVVREFRRQAEEDDGYGILAERALEDAADPGRDIVNPRPADVVVEDERAMVEPEPPVVGRAVRHGGRVRREARAPADEMRRAGRRRDGDGERALVELRRPWQAVYDLDRDERLGAHGRAEEEDDETEQRCIAVHGCEAPLPVTAL